MNGPEITKVRSVIDQLTDLRENLVTVTVREIEESLTYDLKQTNKC